MPSRPKTITLRLGRRREGFGKLAGQIGPAGQPPSLLSSSQPRILDILHDLKSPLARMSVALGLARQQVGVGAQEALDRIELEAERLNQMLRDILELAQVEAGKELLEPEEIDLLGVVKEVTEDANFEALRSNRAVHVVSLAPCRVHGVKGILRSAVENVARNAVQHTAEGTTVEISVAHQNNGKARHAIVCVRDHGQGVPSHLLGEIFRPFFRVHDSPRSARSGTGLGLTIAERAVRLHGGSIIAANHPEGGLAVEIRLPAKARHESNVELRSATRSAFR